MRSYQKKKAKRIVTLFFKSIIILAILAFIIANIVWGCMYLKDYNLYVKPLKETTTKIEQNEDVFYKKDGFQYHVLMRRYMDFSDSILLGIRTESYSNNKGQRVDKKTKKLYIGKDMDAMIVKDENGQYKVIVGIESFSGKLDENDCTISENISFNLRLNKSFYNQASKEDELAYQENKDYIDIIYREMNSMWDLQND